MSGTPVTVGPKGRVVVPAPLRRRLGIQEGTVLYASADGDRLVLEPRSAVLGRLRGRFADVPRSRSLVDELIEERRADAERESRST
jgi:AbrB family looped-hinge helix DNA binding protein